MEAAHRIRGLVDRHGQRLEQLIEKAGSSSVSLNDMREALRVSREIEGELKRLLAGR